MIYSFYILKRRVEDGFMYPFILLGRLIALLRPLHKVYETFFFFPFYHIGGAEKVHAQIAKATGNKNCIIFFTKKSNNNLFWNEFKDSGCNLKDISRYTDNKWLYFVNIIFRGIISGYINSQMVKPVVFNGQCNFGYKLSPWINKKIPQIELIHSLCSFSYIRIPFLPFITRTIMISTVRIQEHLDLYKRYNIPARFEKKIQFIMNAIELPEEKQNKPAQKELVVLYVGRSTAEKRVHLIAQMAKLIKEKAHNIHFQFLGEVKDAIPVELHAYCHFWGNQSDTQLINDVYNKADILILASDTEGFPMVIMEAMARGLAIITTAVGEIPLHVQDQKNGYLIKEYQNADSVIEHGIEHILQLNKDRKLLHTIAHENKAYAFDYFGMPRFTTQYQQLFSELRSNDI